MKFQNSLEYRLLPISFTVLTLCGTWYPENSSDKEKRLYKIYTISILISGIILFIEMFVNIVIAIKNDTFNLENVFAAIVFAVGLYKKINILYYRQRIINFICNYSYNQWYQPKNLTEALIHIKIQVETRWITFLYAIFIGISILLRALTPILEAGTLLVLPLDAWYPYSVDNLIAFWLTYCHQLISGITLTCMHLSIDTLFVGLLLQMYGQLQILKHRLRKIGTLTSGKQIQFNTNNSHLLGAIIAQRIREHENIFRFGDNLQQTFKPILMGQMVVVVPSLIINVYFLSVYTDRLNSKYFTTFFFALVSLMQIYMFCWYGNEIVLSSMDVGDALYECNWMALDQKSKKILLMIIMRTSKSILISAVAAIPLNIDSFIKIMKTSYSAFNLLQQTTNQ